MVRRRGGRTKKQYACSNLARRDGAAAGAWRAATSPFGCVAHRAEAPRPDLGRTLELEVQAGAEFAWLAGGHGQALGTTDAAGAARQSCA
jgi:hypothetical protein